MATFPGDSVVSGVTDTTARPAGEARDEHDDVTSNAPMGQLDECRGELERLRALITEWHDSQPGGGVRHLNAGNALHREARTVAEDKTGPTPTSVTSAALEARRAEILDTRGVTLDELRRRHEAGAMAPEEWDLWAELTGIAVLLGE